MDTREDRVVLNTGMKENPPENAPEPSETEARAKIMASLDLDGSQSIGDIVEKHPGLAAVTLGKRAIKDAGRRLAQIQGLKPGGSSIRTPEMIKELLDRLVIGETITSITCDAHMPAVSTLWNWCEADDKLDAAIKRAQAHGQRTLADLRLNIAAGGEFSTGDVRRDAELIKAINANIAQRNRAEFGERIAIDTTVSVAPVMLPTIAFHDLPAIEVKPIEDDDED